MTIAVISDSAIEHDARVQRIVTSFASHGFMVHLFVPSSQSTASKPFFDSDHIAVYNYALNNSWSNNNVFFWKKYIACQKAVLQTQTNYDFIYVNDYPLLWSGIQLKHTLNAKLIYDSHEIYIETINQFFPTTGLKSLYGRTLIAFNKLLHRRMEGQWIHQADYVVTVCDSFKHFFKERYHVDAKVLKNCPLNLPRVEKTDLLKSALHLPDHANILLYQGAFNYSRGLEKLIESATYFNDNIVLVLLGDGPLQPTLKKMATGRTNVLFHKKVPFAELIRYTASAHIGILLIEAKNRSKELTLPNKVFEYMAAGIPFITNKLPEASSIATQYNCGFVIDDVSPQSIAKAVNEIFSTDYDIYGSNGRTAIDTEFYWSKDFDKLIAAILP